MRKQNETKEVKVFVYCFFFCYLNEMYKFVCYCIIYCSGRGVLSVPADDAPLRGAAVRPPGRHRATLQLARDPRQHKETRAPQRSLAPASAPGQIVDAARHPPHPQVVYAVDAAELTFITFRPKKLLHFITIQCDFFK